MSTASELEPDLAPATSGDIAVLNLASARARSWERFWEAPKRPGIAEYLVEQEYRAVTFLGDAGGLDRAQMLAMHLAHVDPDASRTDLIRAQVASMTHRFTDARAWIARGERHGAPAAAT